MTEAAGRSLGRDTGTSAAGFVVLGVAAYLLLVLGSRTLSARDYSTFAVFWSLLFTFGPGLLLPLEMEVSRAATGRRLRGEALGPLLRRSVTWGGVAAALAAGLAVAIATLGLGLDGVLALALGSSLLVLLPMHLLRGLRAGTGAFGAYSASLAGEGLARLAAVAALAAAGLASVHRVVLAVAVAPVLVLPVLLRRGPVVPAAPSGRRADELGRALVWLLLSSLFLQALLNAAPVAYAFLVSDDSTGRFLNAAALSRVPLFVFAGFQAVLLPSLVRRLHLGEPDLQRWVGRVVGSFLAVAVLLVAGEVLLGPWALRVAFGDATTQPRTGLGLLALATAAWMLAMTLAQLLLALRSSRLIAAVWGTGLGAFLLLVFLPLSRPAVQVPLALAVGALASATVAVLLVRQRLGTLSERL